MGVFGKLGHDACEDEQVAEDGMVRWHRLTNGSGTLASRLEGDVSKLTKPCLLSLIALLRSWKPLNRKNATDAARIEVRMKDVDATRMPAISAMFFRFWLREAITLSSFDVEETEVSGEDVVNEQHSHYPHRRPRSTVAHTNIHIRHRGRSVVQPGPCSFLRRNLISTKLSHRSRIVPSVSPCCMLGPIKGKSETWQKEDRNVAAESSLERTSSKVAASTAPGDCQRAGPGLIDLPGRI